MDFLSFLFFPKKLQIAFMAWFFVTIFKGGSHVLSHFPLKDWQGNLHIWEECWQCFLISWIVPLVYVTLYLANSEGISAERLAGACYTYCKVLKAVQNTSVITMNDLTRDPWFMIFYDRNIAWMFYSGMLYMSTMEIKMWNAQHITPRN